MSRRISSTSAEPSEPSDRYTSEPSPSLGDAGTSNGSSVSRTLDSRRCHVEASGRDRG